MNTNSRSDGGGLVPVSRTVPVLADSSEMRDWAEQLVARARSEGVEVTGDNGLLTAMVRQVLQTGLNVELAEHLGYELYSGEGRGSGNNRNGSYPKTVTTEIGQVQLDMPRDRLGTFEPATVPKHVRRLDSLSGNIISLYAKGMTTGDIQTHLGEIYGTEISGRRSPRSATRSSRTCWHGSTVRWTAFSFEWRLRILTGRSSHAEVCVEQEFTGGEGSLFRADPAGLLRLESV